MAESLRADLTPGEPDDALATRWYACYTRARHEKRVELLLQERGLETFLPLMSRVRQWKDRKKLVDFPLFPSYVFCRFALPAVHQVLSVPGVSTLVKAENRPIWIADEELENVRRFAGALRKTKMQAEPRPYFAEGEWVEVVDGPMKGIRGIVVEQRGRRRVLVGLKAIGQGMEVDINTRILRPIAAP